MQYYRLCAFFIPVSELRVHIKWTYKIQKSCRENIDDTGEAGLETDNREIAQANEFWRMILFLL